MIYKWETGQTKIIKPGSKTVGLSLNRKRPKSIEIDRVDLQEILNKFQHDRENLYHYLMHVCCSIS